MRHVGDDGLRLCRPLLVLVRFPRFRLDCPCAAQMASDSHKRAAPADFEPLDGSGRPPPALRDSAPHDPLVSDCGGSEPINVQDSILYPELSQELLDAASGGWMGELSKRLERAEADGDGGSNVVLSPAEARSLLHTMQQKLGGCACLPSSGWFHVDLVLQFLRHPRQRQTSWRSSSSSRTMCVHYWRRLNPATARSGRNHLQPRSSPRSPTTFSASSSSNFASCTFRTRTSGRTSSGAAVCTAGGS